MMFCALPPMLMTGFIADGANYSVVRNDGRDAILAFPAHEEEPHG